MRFILVLLSENDGSRAVTDTHAVNAHVDKLEKVLASANTAGAFDFDFILASIEHELDNIGSGAAQVVTGEKACGSFDEIGLGVDGAKASHFNLVVVKGVGLENHFDESAEVVANIDDGGNVACDAVPKPAANPAEIGNNVEVLDIEVLAIFLRLRDFGVGSRSAKGEIADDADTCRSSGGQFGGDWETGRVNADGFTAEVDTLLNIAANVGLREFGLKDGLVDISGEFGSRHIGGFFGWESHNLRPDFEFRAVFG